MDSKPHSPPHYIFLKLLVLLIGAIFIIFIIFELKSNIDIMIFKNLKAYSRNFHYCTLEATNKEELDTCYKLENEKYNYQNDQFAFFFVIGSLLSFLIFSIILVYKNIHPSKKLSKKSNKT
jgi:hypothetical protein